MPGITHWQSPRFFAYYPSTGSEPAILAELLIAGLNQVGILWRTSPALQELEEVTLDWLAQLLGLPAGLHGHIEDGASIGTMARPRGCTRGEARRPGRRLLRARALVGAEGLPDPRARGARDAGGRGVPRSVPTRSTSPTPAPSSPRSGRPRRARSTRSARSRTRASARASGCTSTPPTRARPRSAPSCGTRSPAGSGRTRSSSTRTSGSRRRWGARPSGRGDRRTCVPPSASCRSICA